jgi:hypothetical protein
LDVLFDGGNRGSILREAFWVKTQHRQQLPAGFIELAGVPHDIHVSHVVAVPGIDNSAVGDSPFRHTRSSWIASQRGLIPSDIANHGARCHDPVSNGSKGGRGLHFMPTSGLGRLYGRMVIRV